MPPRLSSPLKSSPRRASPSAHAAGRAAMRGAFSKDNELARPSSKSSKDTVTSDSDVEHRDPPTAVQHLGPESKRAFEKRTTVAAHSAVDSLQSLFSEVASAETARQKIKLELASLRCENADLAKRLDESTVGLELAKQREQDAILEAKKAREDLQKECCPSKGRAAQERTGYERKVVTLEQERDALAEELSRNRTELKELKTASEDLEAAKQEVRFLNDKLCSEDEARRQSNDAEKQIYEKYRHLESLLESSYAQNRDLRQALEEAKEGIRERGRAFEKQREKWESRIDEAQRETAAERALRMDPLDKVLRLETVLPRNIIIRGLDS